MNFGFFLKAAGIAVFLSFAGIQATADSLVKTKEMKTPFLGSSLYVPNDNQAHPGVLVLHGSEGGSHPSWKLKAQFLASHGYSALAFCYYDCGRFFTAPHAALEKVEIKKVYEAMDWLRSTSFVSGKKVAVFGSSRGGELALLLASLTASAPGLKAPDAVLVHAPSDVVDVVLNWDWMDFRCWPCRDGTATCSKDPKEGQRTWNPECGIDPRDRSQNTGPWLWSGEILPYRERIQIEKYKGPIFITVGMDDDVWKDSKGRLDGVERAKRLEATLKNAGKTPLIRYFPNEKHQLSPEADLARNELLLDFLGTLLSDQNNSNNELGLQLKSYVPNSARK